MNALTWLSEIINKLTGLFVFDILFCEKQTAVNNFDNFCGFGDFCGFGRRAFNRKDR